MENNGWSKENFGPMGGERRTMGGARRTMGGAASKQKGISYKREEILTPKQKLHGNDNIGYNMG